MVRIHFPPAGSLQTFGSSRASTRQGATGFAGSGSWQFWLSVKLDTDRSACRPRRYQRLQLPQSEQVFRVDVEIDCGGGLPVVGNTGASGPPPPMGATTLSDPLAFLDQTVCDDGSVHCPAHLAQRSSRRPGGDRSWAISDRV